jgi:hypothetical protein
MSEIRQDAPSPDLAEVQQVEPSIDPLPIPPVAIRADGPLPVHDLPSRSCSPFPTVLATAFQKILGGNDLKRKRVTFIGSAAWTYSGTGNPGSGVAIPANVPLTLEHTAAVYASASAACTLATIPEYWAD